MTAFETLLSLWQADCVEKNLCLMTKVILGRSDEVGGCSRTQSQKAKGFRQHRLPKRAPTGASAFPEGASSNGPRCIEQPVSDLRRTQSEQHQQQPAGSIAAVVVRIAHQLRCRR